jgi:ketosteroid isomerase-like protein
MLTAVTVTPPDLDDFIEEYHRALDAFFAGDAEPAKRLYSHRADATLANPFGPVATGWQQVEETMERAAANYREGGASGFETLATSVTPELAYLVELERFEAKVVGEQTSASGALRVTTILRPEDGRWRIVHRHADPITSARSARTVIER